MGKSSSLSSSPKASLVDLFPGNKRSSLSNKIGREYSVAFILVSIVAVILAIVFIITSV